MFFRNHPRITRGLLILCAASTSVADLMQRSAPPLPQAVQTCLEKTGIALISPSSADYNTTAKSQNTIYNYQPSAILAPKSASETASIVSCLTSGEIKVSPFGGGHGYASELRKIESQISANLKDRGVTMPPFNATEFSSWNDALVNLIGNLDAPPNKVPYYAQSLMDDGSPGYSLTSATKIVEAMQKTVNVSETGTSLSFDLNGPSAGTNGEQPNGNAVWYDAGKRSALFLSQIYVVNYPGFDKQAEQDAVNKVVDGVNQAVRDANPSDIWGAYVNYVDPRLKNWEQMYYGEGHVVKRLKELKARVDPKTVFDYPQGLAHAVVRAET
ncbi:Carbohydrate oxidase [Pseudocercospora fuligena]|uniref:Carbohydrate oxidase n=1 Tax=Pseudocercospora fuligena TaxID=685502 RepID=A0A8H6VNP5_9PEZI|nr:Carbohydrate oxidase [Pseudocercospora fuligena]